MVLFLTILGIWLVPHVQGQASGNAIDLAQLNAHMMNTKCAITPCQSACLVPQPGTGCFVCNSACSAGSVNSMTEGGMPMGMQPMSSGQGQGFYSCASETSWSQCPVTCEHKFDNLGCFHCLCNEQRYTDTVDAPITPSPIAEITQTVAMETKLVTGTEKLDLSTSTVTSKPQTSTEFVSSAAVTRPKADDNYFPPFSTASSSILSSTSTPKPSLTSDASVIPSSSTTLSSTTDNSNKTGVTEFYKVEPYKSTDFSVNTLTLLLFGVVGLLLCTLGYFVFVYRRTLNLLRRNKNELYFVEKAHRQDSNARLQSNEMLDPVYAEMPPDPPPRPDWSLAQTEAEILGTRTGSYYTPSRSTSVSSETPVKECLDDNRHDYLELI